MNQAKITFWNFGVVAALALFVSACSQPRIGSAPVVNGVMGERVGSGSPTVNRQKIVTVRRGESLYKISRRYNVRLRGIIEANNLKPPYTIFPGQKLRIPVVRVHIVVRGETVHKIAQRYSSEPGTLVRLNRISPPYRLSPGQRLILPKNIATTLQRGTAPATKLARPTVSSEMLDRSVQLARPNGIKSKVAPLPRRKILSAKQPELAGAPAVNSRGGFIWPVNGPLLSKFGSLGKGLQNDGINILARRGSPVRAIQNGVVAYSGNELRGFGNLLLIKHSGGWISAYAHNEKLLVKTGQRVKRGQVISSVGSTGSVNKPQLHFELRRKSRAVDPERYLGRRTASLKR